MLTFAAFLGITVGIMAVACIVMCQALSLFSSTKDFCFKLMSAGFYGAIIAVSLGIFFYMSQRIIAYWSRV